MKKQIEPIEMYLKAMYEFKHRIIVVGAMCENMYINKKSGNIIDVENICLQIRKLLELIAMSSLIMSKQAFTNAREGFEKMWNAKYILKDIKQIHPDFFPMSISGLLSENNGSYQMEDIKHEVLTEKMFCKIYDKCGVALHIPNPFSVDNNIVKYLGEQIPKWLDLIFLTMKKHMVLLYGTDLYYAVELNEVAENITYTLCQKKTNN